MLMNLIPTLGYGHPNRVTLDVLVSQGWIHIFPSISFGIPNLTIPDFCFQYADKLGPNTGFWPSQSSHIGFISFPRMDPHFFQYMSRNVRTWSQLLSVYYKIAPCHARVLNVLSTTRINFYWFSTASRNKNVKMHGFRHDHDHQPFY